ncbi:MAG TPA: hypothetical protein PK299_08480 [Anaerolineales bacterium]|nr:hypothetical protein [Anaerolineales bacterium]
MKTFIRWAVIGVVTGIIAFAVFQSLQTQTASHAQTIPAVVSGDVLSAQPEQVQSVVTESGTSVEDLVKTTLENPTMDNGVSLAKELRQNSLKFLEQAKGQWLYTRTTIYQPYHATNDKNPVPAHYPDGTEIPYTTIVDVWNRVNAEGICELQVIRVTDEKGNELGLSVGSLASKQMVNLTLGTTDSFGVVPIDSTANEFLQSVFRFQSDTRSGFDFATEQNTEFIFTFSIKLEQPMLFEGVANAIRGTIEYTVDPETGFVKLQQIKVLDLEGETFSRAWTELNEISILTNFSIDSLPTSAAEFLKGME